MSEEKGIIHIKGVGHAEQTPDRVVLSLTLTAQNREYSAAMKVGSQQIEMLRESIVEVGFKADDLKTTNFNVRTIYENEETQDGNTKRYSQSFVGFECQHSLQLAFDFDNDMLSAAVDAIANCLSQPRISVAFTIKDVDAFNEKLLKSAARDAKRKAKLLSTAAGVKLGKLLNIDYSWDEINVRRELIFDEMPLAEPTYADTNFNFQPEDVKATDTVDFTWEIE